MSPCHGDPAGGRAGPLGRGATALAPGGECARSRAKASPPALCRESLPVARTNAPQNSPGAPSCASSSRRHVRAGRFFAGQDGT